MTTYILLFLATFAGFATGWLAAFHHLSNGRLEKLVESFQEEMTAKKSEFDRIRKSECDRLKREIDRYLNIIEKSKIIPRDEHWNAMLPTTPKKKG